MVDSDTKSRLQKMLNSLPIDEVLAFCRDLRDEIMYNVLDLSFDSACDIEETPEPIVNSESIHDLPQYDDFDEGFYDEEEQINIFRTSLASPGAEITFELTVNGKQLTGIIDTGAMKSCLKSNLVTELNSTPVIGKPVRLVGIKPNEPVNGYMSSVNLTIGKYNYNQDVVIANIQNDFILGADFLAKHLAVLDLKNSNIAFDNDLRIPIKVNTHPSNANAADNVRIVHECVLQPRTAQTLKVKVPNKYWKGNLIIESLPDSSHGLIVPSALYENLPELNILVYNFSDAKLKLPAGTAVASVSTGELIRNLVSQDALNPSQNDSEYPEEILDLQKQVPDHLKELFLDSLDGLTYEQSVEVKDLLIEFQDTFSKNPLDLGHFNAFKHPIPTGDALPVRDKFRRTPLKWVEAEREHIKDLLHQEIILWSFNTK